MKKTGLAIAVLLLAGCASSDKGVGLYQLETSQYTRAERNLPMDFVQLQRAVFKRQAKCGTDIRFAVDERHPSYARVTVPFGPGESGWDNILVLGMTQMQTSAAKVLGVTLREESKAFVRTRLYSYYSPSKDQIKRLYGALLHPEDCEGVLGDDLPPPPPEPDSDLE